jgi:predicted nuclease of predicted toxin-antitoxin system
VLVIADENVDFPIIVALREAGYRVRAVTETSPSLADTAILAEAASAEAVLLTLDRDFGDLIFSQGLQAPYAVIYVRPKGMRLADLIEAIFSALRDPALAGLHVTIDRNQRRTRVLPNTGETNG